MQRPIFPGLDQDLFPPMVFLVFWDSIPKRCKGTNACTPDAEKTLRNARTAGKAASVRADEKRKRYPPQDHPHAELVPFVVEARGRLGEEVLPFLRHHAPAEEPFRSAVLARALRDISIITQQGLAALLLAAEPRPASV